MKSLKTKYGKLIAEQRWDIDYHLPPISVLDKGTMQSEKF